MLYLLYSLFYYFCLFLIGVIIYDSYWVLTDPCKLPGPYGIPLIGYLPFIGKRPHCTFTELAKKYGPIFQLRVGTQKLIVLNDLDLIKEAFAKHEFTDRPKLGGFQTFSEIAGPIAAMAALPDGPILEYSRKLSIRSIGTMVNSKDSRVERLSNDAVEYALAHMKDGSEDAIEVLKTSVGIVVGSLSFGHVFDANSETLQKIFGSTKAFNDFLALGGVADFVPLIGFFFRWKANQFKALVRLFSDYVNSKIDEHHLNSTSEIRDIQDALEHLYGTTKEELLGKLNLSLKEVKHVGQALFGAGFPTTSEHYGMALLILATYPDIQQKVYEDIKAAVGSENVKDEISLDDRNRMPYTQAFLTELLRYFSHAPYALPHATSSTVTLGGHVIPAGSQVLSNLWNVHHNKEVFGPDVYTFNPHRFLDESTVDERIRNVVAFGVGRRKCVGELLARREMFLLIAKTVQKAQIKLVEFDGIDPSDTDVGFTLQTKPMKLQLIPR